MQLPVLIRKFIHRLVVHIMVLIIYKRFMTSGVNNSQQRAEVGLPLFTKLIV